VPAKPGFVPLSPGPEKAKLHMDAVASLLGLSSVDKQQAAALANAAAKTTVPKPALNQWAIIASTRPGAPLRAAKRLSSSEIYSRSLTIPRTIFESLFGKQSSATTTALIEPSAGALLALAAEATAGSHGSPAHFSLRAGPLVNALRATAGDVIVLTALDTDAAAAGAAEAPPRARASLGLPTDIPSSGTGTGTAGGTANILAYGHESRSASGSPGSLDSLTHALSEVVNDGTEEEPSNAYAAAATLTATDHLGSSEGLDAMEDPEWHHGSRGGGSGARSGAGTRTRGRPRKHRQFGSVGGYNGSANRYGGSQRAAAAAAVNLSCSHCGTRETPRWWKDAFPLGTLCNACGIWLKRHGYPRPVQFFSVPSAAGAPPAAATTAATVAANVTVHGHHGGSQQGPSPGEFYLINGRPKRRRAAMHSTFGRGDDHHDGSAMAAAMVAAAAAHSDAHDAAINYQAAGGRVFVMRRKLIANPDDGIVIAALVHFGWAPGARAAHEMFEKVSSYGTRSSAITVEDFELLGDTKATATLTLRTDAGQDAPEDWDALVRDFIESL